MNINYFHKGKFNQISLRKPQVDYINYYNTDNYLKHYDDYCKFFGTVVLRKDNLLSWIEEKKNIPNINFINLLSYGIIKKDTRESLSPLPSGWEWKQTIFDKRKYILSFNYLLKYNYTPYLGSGSYASEQTHDATEKSIDFYTFYDKNGSKICEICRHDKLVEFVEFFKSSMYGFFDVKEKIRFQIKTFFKNSLKKEN